LIVWSMIHAGTWNPSGVEGDSGRKAEGASPASDAIVGVFCPSKVILELKGTPDPASSASAFIPTSGSSAASSTFSSGSAPFFSRSRAPKNPEKGFNLPCLASTASFVSVIPLTTLDRPAPILARLALLPERDLLLFSGVRVPSDPGPCVGRGGAGKGNVVRFEMVQVGYETEGGRILFDESANDGLCSSSGCKACNDALQRISLQIANANPTHLLVTGSRRPLINT
jgi:hypothetical protein